jgi:murein DD-endopeptidase MepM/ murein hydrolase activator NlpD
MEDDRRRETLIGIVDELDGRYVFPVPDAPEAARRDALSVGRTYYEFGGDRGRHRKHNAVDIYAFGDEVVAFADGEVLMIGRHRHDFDHGNIIVLRHAEADGRALYTYYLHVGAVSSALSVGTRVAKGQPLARVDCTGISDSNWRLYDLGSRRCMEKAHLHFQIRVEDMHVNPNYFFPEYSRDRLPELRGTRLSIPASPLSELEGRVVPFRQGETLGSFREPVGGER